MCLSITKYSRATNRVNWLSGEKNTNVSRTLSVLVFRVVISTLTTARWLATPCH
jgi:hypothetical protein